MHLVLDLAFYYFASGGSIGVMSIEVDPVSRSRWIGIIIGRGGGGHFKVQVCK